MTADCPEGSENWDTVLKELEVAADFIWLIEVVFNFFKWSKSDNTLTKIGSNYMIGFFIFDAISIVPLFLGQPIRFLALKAFRIVHASRFTYPLELILESALQRYSKKKQNDLISFAELIFAVIYVSHLLACLWLYHGH